MGYDTFTLAALRKWTHLLSPETEKLVWLWPGGAGGPRGTVAPSCCRLARGAAHPQHAWGRDAGRESAARPGPHGVSTATLWGVRRSPHDRRAEGPQRPARRPAGAAHSRGALRGARTQPSSQAGRAASAMPPACRSPCPAAGSPSRWHTAPLAPERPRPGAVTGLRPRPPRGTEGSGRAELLTDPRSGERLRADGSPLSGHLLPLPLPRTRAARGCAGHRVASSRPVWQPCPAQPCGGPRPAARTPQGSPARAATA